MLTSVFQEIDTWFDKPEALRAYRPKNGGWSVNEILEHITLTNHFLLILVEKGTRKALDQAAKLGAPGPQAPYDFHRDQLTEVGIHQSFEWIRPEHMEPAGQTPLPELRTRLREQVARCLSLLDQLKNGEGTLYKTTMSVNGLGKIDVYEYLYFLAQHGRRHRTQLERAEAEYGASAAAAGA